MSLNFTFNIYPRMQNKIGLIVKNYLFFACFGIWISINLAVLFCMPKYASFTAVNHFRSFFADIFFTIVSYVGGEVGFIPVALYFLLKKKYKSAIGFIAGCILVSIAVSVLKHDFNMPRPVACYGKSIVKTASWTKLYRKYSFPSGHTATAFCVAVYLSLLFPDKKKIVVWSFIAACLTGYSRVYLGEHFWQDVCFGSLIGVACGVVSYRLTTLHKSKRESKILADTEAVLLE